ncbi:uncharacterized protein LOC133886058 [Phragmites australis]|uniref:uncharacterized protein LOC133886058 n=1 Tax=Phragmites australis TaxID=29695 RepID=UPI002D782B42|nr:uncharacterized protein LOC133886058 [Phragmites australis]
MAAAPSGSAASMHAGGILLPAASSLRPRPPLRPSRPRTHVLLHLGRANADMRCRRRLLTARGERPHHDDDEEEEEESAGFDAAVALFNRGEYHACHDVVEELWYGAEDPARTLLHGILQCAVGLHHLFNQNHRGAMMELGEGLCKLRKLHLDEDEDDDGDGPFSRFREEVAAVLHFLYRTQKELAACTDELCLTMDGSPSSYQLLGNFAAGQQLYRLEADADGASRIIFSASDDRVSQAVPPAVKLPTLHATEQNLRALQCTYEYM